MKNTYLGAEKKLYFFKILFFNFKKKNPHLNSNLNYIFKDNIFAILKQY